MRELSLIFANPDPSKKAGCSKCRYVGCKACRGYTQKEKEMWERQQGTRSDRQGEAGTVVVVPDTGEKEQDPAHVAGEQQQVRGEITDGLVLMTEADFCVDLEGKEVMVYWGKTFKAWYRARVVRFDDRARKAFL